MKRIMVFCAFFILACVSFSFAATLDELNRPLLKKGGWRADVDQQSYNEDYKYRYDDLATPPKFVYYDENHWEYSMNPTVYYGLSDTLQASVSGDFYFPYSESYTQYNASGGEYYNKYNSKYDNYITEQLTWRPNQSWEVYFMPSQGFYKSEGNDKQFSSGMASRNYNKEEDYGFETGAYWLSNPQPGNKTTNNRADLDGLINPLLDARQIEVYLPIQYMFGYFDGKGNRDLTASEIADWMNSDGRFHALSLNPQFTYGILNNLQVDTGCEFYLPGLTHSHNTWESYQDDGLGNVTQQYERYNYRPLNEYDMYLRFTQRPHQQFQWYVKGAYNYEKTRENGSSETYFNGVQVSSSSGDYKYRNSEIIPEAGFTWISKPQGKGKPLAPDMDGLKQPLLEKHQVRVDSSFSWYKYGSWSSDSGKSPFEESWDITAKVSYGILDKLQAYISVDVMPQWDYREPTPSGSFRSTHSTHPSFGAGVTYRPKASLELFLNCSIGAPERMKGEYFTGSALEDTYYNQYRESTINAGATILW